MKPYSWKFTTTTIIIKSTSFGSLYRGPSQLVADITQFTEESSETLAKTHATCKQSYINGDYNIDLILIKNILNTMDK